jgi:hypothetical protein
MKMLSPSLYNRIIFIETTEEKKMWESLICSYFVKYSYIGMVIVLSIVKFPGLSIEVALPYTNKCSSTIVRSVIVAVIPSKERRLVLVLDEDGESTLKINRFLVVIASPTEHFP